MEKRPKPSPATDEYKILTELKQMSEFLKDIRNILDAQWRGREPKD